MTKYEREVLEMCAMIRDWQRGSWVNACIEFLQEDGYVERNSTKLTEKGRKVLSEYKET